MNTIGCSAACQVSLASHQETNKAKLGAHQEPQHAQPAHKFDWEKNSQNLRKLADAHQAEETETEVENNTEE
jgi:hypothetical protein